MKPTLWRLAAASGVAVALALGAGPAAASSSGSLHRPEPTAVQVADQTARTEQDAESSAESKQFLPVNANVPVQILSLGKNGGDTKQSSNSTAKSSASNEAWTKQSVDQDQKVGWLAEPKGHDRYGHEPKGHDDHRDKCPKGQKPEGHGPKDHGPKDHDQYGHGPKGHGPKDHEGGYRPKVPRAIQLADQEASTDQDATSSATSKQIAPVNLNVPVQILSLGKNGGDTKQSNDSTAKSAATNEADTLQSANQDQGSGSGAAFQGAGQTASTDQDATSSAKSEQIAPVNVNAPIQILSIGSNGGDTHQSNNSTAESSATNQAGTTQVVSQAQGLLG